MKKKKEKKTTKEHNYFWLTFFSIFNLAFCSFNIYLLFVHPHFFTCMPGEVPDFDKIIAKYSMIFSISNLVLVALPVILLAITVIVERNFKAKVASTEHDIVESVTEAERVMAEIKSDKKDIGDMKKEIEEIKADAILIKKELDQCICRRDWSARPAKLVHATAENGPAFRRG